MRFTNHSFKHEKVMSSISILGYFSLKAMKNSSYNAESSWIKMNYSYVKVYYKLYSTYSCLKTMEQGHETNINLYEQYPCMRVSSKVMK